jgi:hypothetical protein
METSGIGSATLSTSIIEKSIKTQETQAGQLMGILESAGSNNEAHPSASSSFTGRGRSIDIKG